MRWIQASALLLALCAAVSVGRSTPKLRNRLDPPDPTEHLPPSESVLGVYNEAAVSANGAPCASVGRDIMARGGNAVEGAIAALFCDGITCPQSMGLGGGFFMTVYEKATGKVSVLNAREMAPAAATKDMFDGDAEAAQYGGMSVAVPGELKGYWEAFQRFQSGQVTWEDLITPTMEMCRDGIVVTDYLARIMRGRETLILSSPSLSEILIDPQTGRTWVSGDILKRPKLAETLQVIAQEGGDALYTGSLMRDFVRDIEELGGIITEEDMANYKVEWVEPLTARLSGGLTMYAPPPPSSGVLEAFIFNVLNGFVPAPDEITTYHRVVETFKYAFGKRTELGDPNFVDIADLVANLTSPTYAAGIRAEIFDDRTFQDPEHYGAVVVQPDDHGTAHLSVLSPNGDAVSVTSTINLLFGSKMRSVSTGIILNDIMDDFSSPNITNDFGVPPSPANFIEPGKRPLSSMCPTIFVDDEGNVRLVVGAAGGTKIITATALVSMHNLWENMDIKESVDEFRFHHQLFPMALQYEYGMLAHVVDGLADIGHVQKRYFNETVVSAIARQDGQVFASYDFRRTGETAGF